MNIIIQLVKIKSIKKIVTVSIMYNQNDNSIETIIYQNFQNESITCKLQKCEDNSQSNSLLKEVDYSFSTQEENLNDSRNSLSEIIVEYLSGKQSNEIKNSIFQK